jgi:hypothetical protein
MAVSDEYRKQAERCQQRAVDAIKDSDKAFWLLLAENWQKLAEDYDQRPPFSVKLGIFVENP